MDFRGGGKSLSLFGNKILKIIIVILYVETASTLQCNNSYLILYSCLVIPYTSLALNFSDVICQQICRITSGSF